MATSPRIRILLLFCCILIRLARATDWPCDPGNEPVDLHPPPELPKQFHAVIEMVTSGPLSKQLVTYNLDYDNDGNRAAIANAGSNGAPERARRIIDYGHDQTFLIETGKNNRCKVTRPADDDANHVLSNFPGIFDPIGPGKIFGPGEFFGINQTNFAGYLGQRFFRNNVTCDVWAYCKKGPTNEPGTTKNIFVYFSKEGWYADGGSRRQPMGVVWRQKNPSANEANEVTMTIADFQPNYINLTAFQVPKGVACTGVTGKPFPKIPTTDVFSYKTEIHIPEQKEILYSHNRIDMTYGFARNTIPKLDPTSKGTTINTFDYKRKVIFVQDSNGGCQVSPIDKEVSIVESIGNFDLIGVGDVSKFFQPPGVEWIYVGQQKHRSIPTEVWQAQRTNWPPSLTGVTSVWEWHITQVTSNKFVPGEDPVPDTKVVPVHLRITIVKSGPETPFLKVGSAFLFHLYDFMMDESGTNDLYAFDVSNCYRDMWKRHIQFNVNITGQGLTGPNLQRFIRGPAFLLQWQDFIAVDVLDRNLLRISQLESYVDGQDNVVIQFWLLSNHPDIPSEMSSVDLQKAWQKLKTSIDEGTLQTSDEIGTPIVGSLQDVAINCPDITPTKSPTSTNNPVPSMITPAKSLTEATYSAGAAAGVSIGLFLVGLTTGGGITLLMVIKNFRVCVSLRGRAW